MLTAQALLKTPTLHSVDAGWSPPVVLEAIPILDGKLHVAREDLLPGGTKQRAVIPFLNELRESGVESVIYASPFCGFAQVALAVSAHALGIPVHLFCERDPAYEGSPRAHEFTRLSEAAGASITLCDSLTEAEDEASAFAADGPGRFKIPLGFQHPRYLRYMKEKVAIEFERISSHLGKTPSRVWLPVGSGTLTGIFREIVPQSTRLLCLDVRVLPPEDARLMRLTEDPRVSLRRAEEKFSEPAAFCPPLPSNIHYDAKLWRLICADAQDGDVWWNVAR